jgi:hypothetical protein
MNSEQQQLEALQDIRKMMKESSRFLSLSGISGILAGVYALAGAYAASRLINSHGAYNQEFGSNGSAYEALAVRLVLICVLVLAASVSTALLLSAKKARRNNHRLFDHTSRKLIWNMLVPLLTGGILCVALLIHGRGFALLVCPAMLIFYGLAMVSASRLTLSEIRYLGYSEIALGLVAAFITAYPLLFWSIGFGVLHIIYGAIMWYRYDRSS